MIPILAIASALTKPQKRAKKFVGFALFCGLALSARAQIGTGWASVLESYDIQTSSGCTAVPLPSGIGGVFNIPSSISNFRAEFRFEHNLPGLGISSGTEQFQGDITLNNFTGGNRVTVKQTFEENIGSWSLIAIDQNIGGFYDVHASPQALLAPFAVGQTARINTIVTFSGQIPTVNVYINGTHVEQLVGDGATTVYDKVGAYKSSSGSGPCTTTWQNILFWTGGSANGGTPVVVDTPSFSPAAGSYTSTQAVTVSSTTSGASIAYTTDGSIPTESGGSVTHGTALANGGTVSVGGNTTLNAIAFASGQTDSRVSTSAYAINISNTVSAPTFSPAAGTYGTAQTVTLSSTSGASIAYTTDGSTPTESGGSVAHGTPLANGGTVSISATTTLNAMAFASGQTDSTVATAAYLILSPVAAPTFSPAASTYANAQSVTLSSTTSGASIAYTTDGSTPAEFNGTITNGVLYSGAVSIAASATLNAIAFKNGMADSTMASAVYTLQAATPSFSPAAGTYNSAQSVTISSATSGVSIRYTTDGVTTPTETVGTVYSGPVTVNATTTLNAIAYETGFTDSTVATGAYTLQAATPSFSPSAGTYTSVQSVTISSATSGASIRYTTDGVTTPTETGGTLYSGAISIGATTTLNAIAYETGFTDSTVATGGFTINLPLPTAAAPTFSPVAGTYTSAQTVNISSTTSGATIRYTTDGSTPTETNGTVYSSPVSIGSSAILKAIAYENGFIDSAVTSGIYTITSSPAAILNVIYDFSSANNGGISPFAGLVLGSDGNFYGTTNKGGSSNDGIVFQMTPTGVLASLVTFTGTNGANPEANLVQGSDGNFYGTTASGGSSNDGTVFIMTPTGSLTTLISFTGTANGANPSAGLIQGSDGNFYGTTPYGGSSSLGTVFKMTPAGVLTTLVSFTGGTNGSVPFANLIQGSDGNFYGTTSSGGNGNNGTIFKITTSGALTTLFSFNGTTNGAQPEASLIQGTDGNFYGTTQAGGSASDGTVFKMTPAGALTTLVSFNGTNGQFPNAGLTQGNDGNFYSTTQNGGSGNDGTIFQMTPAGVLTTLISFDGANGQLPDTGLVQGSDGNFYGTTGYFAGVTYQLIIPATAAPAFSPAAGTYTSAQTVTISSTTSGATVIYTTDGSTPSQSNGTTYSTPLTISATTTVKAIAYKSGFTTSGASTATFTIQAATSSSTPTAASSSGGGGGGAMDGWFLGILAFAGLLRWRSRRTN